MGDIDNARNIISSLSYVLAVQHGSVRSGFDSETHVPFAAMGSFQLIN